MPRSYSPSHISDGLLILPDTTWFWFALPTESKQYSPVETYEAFARNVARALDSVVPDSGELKIQLRIVRKPFDSQRWHQALLRNNPAGANLDSYAQKMRNYLDSARFNETAVFLGIENQSSPREEQSFLKALLSSANTLAGGRDTAPAESELLKLERQLAEYAKALTEHVGAREADSEEIAWLIRKPYWNTENCPSSDLPENATFDAAFISSLVEETVVTHGRYLEVGEAPDSFYTTFLSLGTYPENLNWPQELSWYSQVTGLEPEAEITINANITQLREVLRRLGKLKTAVHEEAEEAHEFDTSDAGDMAERASEVAVKIKQAKSRGTGWIDMTCRIQLRGTSPEDLNTRSRRLQKALRDSSYTLQRPAHEQYDLLLEALPGGARQDTLHSISTDLEAIGATGALLSFKVGDDNDAGMYIGYTTEGEASPVFLDPNRAPMTNNPPGVLISGKPGFGKTFLTLTLAYSAYLQGKTVVYVDPKSDSDDLATWIGTENINYIDMTSAEPGLLDPFVVAESLNDEEDPNLAFNAVVGICTMLTGIQNERTHKDAIVAAVREVIDTCIARGDKPSMNMLVQFLSNQKDQIPRSLGAQLSGYASDRYGRLLFSDGRAKLDRAAGKFTIIVMNGLSLPEQGTPREEYQPEHAVAMAVFYSTMMFAQRLMMLDALSGEAGKRMQKPKAVLIDEAWTLFATAEGRSAANSILRLGRSMNTAFTLVTQKVSDIPGSNTYISTYFAFNPGTDPANVDDVAEALALEINREDISSLPRGTCLMRDTSGRKARVRIDPWDKELFAAIDTTPGS